MTYATIILNKHHKKNEFDCGQPLLNAYIQKQASQDYKRHLSTCFVLTDDGNQITGYYTLSSASIPGSILPEDIRSKLPPSYEHLPVTLLGRLAVDVTAKGKGFGELLLVDALKRSYDVASDSIGSMAIIVDPIDEQAVAFYLKYGFIKLPDSGKMFISMKTIKQLFIA